MSKKVSYQQEKRQLKKRVALVVTVLFTAALFLPNVFGQQATQLKLPPGAIARLGKGWVKDMRFSPDGASLAVGTTIGVWIYDVSTGKEIDLLRGWMGGANAIAYSPTNDTLAIAHEDRTVRLWTNVSSGAATVSSIFQGHTGDIRAIAFSKDGNMIASGGTDNTIRIWDVHAEKLMLILPGYDSTVSTVGFSSDSRMIAGGSKNGTIRVWDAGIGDRIYEFDGHTELVSEVFFFPSDTILVSASLDGTVRLWDLVIPGGSLSDPKQHGVPVYTVAASPNWPSSVPHEYTLVSGSADKLIRVWNMKTNQLVPALKRDTDLILDGHTDSVRKVRLSPDGRTLASASSDGTVRLWDRALKRSRLILQSHTGGVKALVYTTDNRIHVCGTGLDGKLRLWDAGTGVVLSVIREHTGLTEAAAFSSDGKTLASAGLENGTIFLSDVDTASAGNEGWHQSSLQRTLTGNSDGITALAFSPAGTTLASGGLDGKIHLLEIANRRKLTTFRGPESTVSALTFAIDGTFLTSGEQNGTFRAWNSLSGEEIVNSMFQSEGVGALAFSPTTRFLAIGDAIGIIWLYDFKTNDQRIIFTQHTRKITALAFSKNGRTLISGSEDGTILLWDVEGQLTQTEETHRLKKHKATPLIQSALNSTVHLKIGKGGQNSQGSGFFIHPGYVATNYHVIKGAEVAYVKSVANDTTYTFEEIAAINEQHDLAIIKISITEHPVLDLGNSDDVHIGETIYTIGNPKGLQGTVSRGIISSIRDLGDSGERIQIDAPISPGNSGGPVLNEKGKVIGVSVSVHRDLDAQNLNFAIPSNYLKALLRKVQ